MKEKTFIINPINMKENYQAWKVDVKDFFNLQDSIDKLKFLINFAVLAPSSHNSQPWQFAVSENQITVLPDFKRALPFSDKNNRQLYLSLGAAIENILVAADYYGYNTRVEYLPDQNDRQKAATVFLQKEHDRQPEQDHLVFSILKRHSNRNKYKSDFPEEGFINWLKQLSSEEIHIHLITQKERKDKVATLVNEAMIAAMDDSAFREELSHYVKPNITKSKLGMPLYGFGMPTPLSFMGPFVLKKVNVNRKRRKMDEAVLKEYTPMFVVLSSPSDNMLDWIKVGKLYQEIALQATKNNLNTAVMAAAVQIGEFYKELQELLETQNRPQFFFRLGYAKSGMKHSPRIPAREVIV